MDLFHSITQGLDNVLTCHWYDELKNFSSTSSSNNNDDKTNSTRSRSGSIMSTAEDKTMDTVPGGENTQYEGAVTENVPTSKQRGQLGSTAGPNTTEPDQSVSQDRAEKTADNIRYGQNISESGMGGMTTTSTGQAAQGGYGGVEADKDQESPDQTRKAQGYGSGSGVGG